MTTDPEEDGFLSRWSRRKRSGEGDTEDAAEEPAEEPVVPEVSDDAPLSDDEILAKYNLPDPDTLEPGDDYGAYLKAPLPIHLQRRALRLLWKSNPVLANLDGLNDYDTDFTGDTVPLGQLKTAYKVGQGYLKHIAHMQDSEAGKEPVAEDAEEALAKVDLPEEADPEPEMNPEDLALMEDAPSKVEEPEGDTEDTAALPTKRRMAFRFPNET